METETPKIKVEKRGRPRTRFSKLERNPLQITKDMALWKQCPEDYPQVKSIKDFARWHRINPEAARRYERAYYEEKDKVTMDAGVGDRRKDVFIDNLWSRFLAEKATAEDKKILAKYFRIADISEVDLNLELSATEYFRIREEARREISKLHQATKGTGDMQRFPLLPEEVREDTGQD